MSATRRLAAILAADVAGYSALIGADEEGTLERLREMRAEVSDPKIAEHRGMRPRPLARIISPEEQAAHAMLIADLGPNALWLAIESASGGGG